MIKEHIFDFAPPSDEPVFTVYWRGRKDKDCSGWWHTPGVMDGGFCASYFIKGGVCNIQYSSDNFWGSDIIEQKSFNVEKCKEYEIYIKDDHIEVPGVELEVIWDRDIAEAERIKREKDEEEYRKAHPEEYVDLGNGSFVRKLRLVRCNMPTTIRDKIFSETVKEPNTDSIQYVRKVKYEKSCK